MIQRINKFPDSNNKNICYKVIDNNSYFAHGESILIGMLADDNEEVRRKAVNKVLYLKGLIEDFHGEEVFFVYLIVEKRKFIPGKNCCTDYELWQLNFEILEFFIPRKTEGWHR